MTNRRQMRALLRRIRKADDDSRAHRLTLAAFSFIEAVHGESRGVYGPCRGFIPGMVGGAGYQPDGLAKAVRVWRRMQRQFRGGKSTW